ncbi:MAG: histidine kinase, partial [Spirochaetia bacterium]
LVVGFLLLVPFGLYDVLAGLGVIPWTRPYAHIGMLLFIFALAAVLQRRIVEIHRNTIRYSQHLQRITEEKDHIVRELHDGISGTMTNILLLTEIMRQGRKPGRGPGPRMPAGPAGKKKREALNQIAALAAEGMVEIKTFMQGMDEKDLSWEAVGAEFRLHGSKTLKLLGISFNFMMKCEKEARKPDASVFINLYRIYREALINIIKHAKAAAVTVSLQVSRAAMHLTIQDNGRGFYDLKAKGRGILNMKSRAQEIGGELTIESRRGTQINLSIPFAEGSS